MQPSTFSRSIRVLLDKGAEPVPGYRLTCHIGAGAFGEVWEARAADGSVVALKFLDYSNKSSTVSANEIRALLTVRKMQHPHIIQLHNVCAGSSYLVLVMERADSNLTDFHQAHQEKGKNIPLPLLLGLLNQAAAALDYLADPRAKAGHFSAGSLQHCDIKPSNLLLVGGSLKVADFGLCRPESQSTSGPCFLGTPPYAAPELHQGRPTCRTDQYGLAVTYCELCMGLRVFRENAFGKPSRPVMPIDLCRVRESEVPVLARALDPRWTYRWPNCQAFISALRTALTAPRSDRRTDSRSRPWA